MTDCADIVQYWHSASVPCEVAALTDTFRRCNPGLRHRVFDKAERFIVQHLTPREATAFRACAVPAMQADYFRYCAILVLAGIWSDVGLRCLGSLNALTEATTQGMLFRPIAGRPLGNSFFIFKRRNHPLLQLTLEIATTNIERRADRRVNVVTGPWIFSVLNFLHTNGSLEPAILVPKSHPQRAAIENLLTVVGDYGVLSNAFAGVQVVDLNDADNLVTPPTTHLQYKYRATRWTSWPRRRGDIFN